MSGLRVAVVGDLLIDFLNFEKLTSVPEDAQSVGVTRHRAPPMAVLQIDGGAAFIAGHLRRALKGIASISSYSQYDVDQFPLLPPSIVWDLREFGKGDARCLRLSNPRRFLSDAALIESERGQTALDRHWVPAFPELPRKPHVLVFDDLGLFFRQVHQPELYTPNQAGIYLPDDVRDVFDVLIRDYSRQVRALLESFLAAKARSSRAMIATLGTVLFDTSEDTIWKWIFKTFPRPAAQTILILNAHDLRESGIAVSTGISWERTADDLVEALETHPLLQQFRWFDHIVIRLGITGALHSFQADRGRQPRLHFNPELADNSFEDPEANGIVLGYNTIFVASILQNIAIAERGRRPAGAGQDYGKSIGAGIGAALARCRWHFDQGYGQKVTETRNWLPQLPDTPCIEALYNKAGPSELSRIVKEYSDGLWVASADVPHGPPTVWSIVRNSCAFDAESLAKRIVLRGVRDVFRKKGSGKGRGRVIEAPLVRFNDATFVDRAEIEAFRSVHKLIERQLRLIRNGQAKRPLSIAVFGPPGSGKSFGVREVIKSIETTQRIDFLTFNIAQFTSISDLDNAFAQIVNSIASHHVPIVFWDEFDCASSDTGELGWLKFFLAPMEDGLYKQNNPVKEAVFVFAGGTSTRFGVFAREEDADDEKKAAFSEAKGTDFVSRLSGHVDILGINPCGPGDDSYIIRRAIVLRDSIARLQSLKPHEVAAIDEDLLRGLLLVSSFKHGARSLRAILELCSNKFGHIRKSAMPMVSQLKMHTDADAFIRVVKGIESRFDNDEGAEQSA